VFGRGVCVCGSGVWGCMWVSACVRLCVWRMCVGGVYVGGVCVVECVCVCVGECVCVGGVW